MNWIKALIMAAKVGAKIYSAKRAELRKERLKERLESEEQLCQMANAFLRDAADHGLIDLKEVDNADDTK